MKPFPRVHIIHNSLDTEREKVLEEEVASVGINVQLWESIACDNVITAVVRAHKQIVKWAMERGKEEVIIAEDDFHFPAGRKGLDYFFENKPIEYDIYLAGVYVGKDKLPFTRRLFQFSGMHFYFVHSRFFRQFLDIDESQSIDNSLSALAKTGVAEIYSLYPMAAIQHENVSATSGCVFKHEYFFNKDNVYGYRDTADR